jgi:inner membrane transporter RhtA
MHDQTPPTRGLHLPPIPAVLVGIVSVQGGAAMAKGIFPVLGPAGMTAMRISMAALLLLAFLRPSVHRFTRAQWGAVVPYGITLGVMNLTFYLALARIPLGLAVTLEFLGPLAVAVVGSRRGSDLLWVALAAAGVVLLAPWGGRADALDLTGVGLALVAGACWGGYILLGARASRHLQGNEGVAVGMAVAALTVLPFTLPALAAARLTPSLLAAGLGVAVLSSALPYTLEMSALRALPSRTFGILMSLEPAVAALAGLVFLGEHLSAPQWVAVACVTAASAGSTLTARGAAPPIAA